ncbi:MAG: flagellin [Cycloclasticus pugetii]|jgi:flagellin|uniref:Flagellin n=1 Tax=Cycloclasticus zancles 78-ME TaxID=1198232 RepID=S5TW60_9GAMM|nr:MULTISPECIES: flagellin [Cycloclasticus]AGS39395.1 Flagellin protein FlaB [Cycloclasticus zancles 78-ME]PHR48458.1 MAG: flagellin FliC [Cycloclasticus sp.]SHI41284.1 flagellin [Cycloclasticus pugetii]
MPQFINSNIASLTAQRNLDTSQSSLNTSLQRLSSGLRINSAKDDAAGLAISERFTTQIRGLNQAARNANDAISLSQTAEGALGEIGNNLQRIRELAVQSANSTNSSSDRAALNLEVQQRLAEIDRVSSQTSFNGQKILDGTFGSAQFQVGANVGESISLDLSTSTRQADLGAVATATSSVDLSTIISAGTAAVTGSAADYTFDAANLIADYSSIAAVAGTDTIDFSTGTPNAGDTVTVNGVVFTLADSTSASSVDSATAVTVNVDFGGGATAQDAVDDFVAAFGLAVTDAGSAGTGTALSGLSAGNAGGTTTTATISDTAAGLAATVGRTVAASDATVQQDVTGSDADNSANRTFTIDDADGDAAVTVTLNSNITSAADLQGVINAARAGTEFAATVNGTEITLTDDSNFTGSFAIGGTNAALITAELVSSTAGVTDVPLVAANSVTVSGDFSIQIGAGTSVAVSDGTYSTVQSLVDAVNTSLAGNAEAVLNTDNTLSIIANDTIAVTGTVGNTTIGLAASTAVTGDLSTASVDTVANSETTIRQVDSALSAVSSLRSTFGAIQNRFESTIANLATTTENLSAARSRIQDADFAAETAALTRAQILQQAGVSILSQANSLPQNVLALLQ